MSLSTQQMLAVANMDNPDSLSGYAALAAATELANNWSPALRDGWGDDIIKSDIDEVIARLRKWAAEVRFVARGEGGIPAEIS